MGFPFKNSFLSSSSSFCMSPLKVHLHEKNSTLVACIYMTFTLVQHKVNFSCKASSTFNYGPCMIRHTRPVTNPCIRNRDPRPCMHLDRDPRPIHASDQNPRWIRASANVLRPNRRSAADSRRAKLFKIVSSNSSIHVCPYNSTHITLITLCSRCHSNTKQWVMSLEHKLGLLSKDRSAASGYNERRTTLDHLFRCHLIEWSTIMSFVAQEAHLKWLQSQKQSTAGWLTPNDDLTQWDSSLCLPSVFSVFQRKRKTECWGFVMAAGSGLKNLQRSDTKCWGQGRQCGSKSNTLWWWRTCVWAYAR